MSRYPPLWQQNATYPASSDRLLVAAVFAHAGVTGMAPSALPGPGLAVSIDEGIGVVPIDPTSLQGGSVLCISDAPEVVPLQPAPPLGDSRIDLIVLQVRDTEIDLGADNDFRFVAIQGFAVPGTPAVPPLPPLAIPIATVRVPGSAAAFPPAVLTDLRAPADPAGSVFVSLGRTGPYTIPGDAQPTVLAWDTVVEDPLNLFDPTTFAFTAPIDGIFFVSAKLCGIGASGTFLGMSLQRDGILAYEGASPYNSFGGGTAVHPFISVSVRLRAGQTLQLTASGNDPAQYLYGGAAQNYCNINYVARG